MLSVDRGVTVVVIAARLMITVVAVGAGYAVLFVVAAVLLPLGSVPLAMAVVDVGSKVAAVKIGAKIRLVDLLVPTMWVYRAVGARLRLVVGVLLP